MASRHTHATKMVMDDMAKVIDSFGDDDPFMSDETSKRTQARKALIASAPADIRGLMDQGYSQSFVLDLVKKTQEQH